MGHRLVMPFGVGAEVIVREDEKTVDRSYASFYSLERLVVAVPSGSWDDDIYDRGHLSAYK